MNWIIDKEPTENGVYLTTLVSGDITYVVLCNYSDGKWSTSGEVKAWMNLPSPYEK